MRAPLRLPILALVLALLTCAVWAALPSSPPVRDDFIRGMSFAHVHMPGYGYGSDRATAELKRLAGLGVDWIAIMPFGYMRRVDRPDISLGRLDPTMRNAALEQQITDAHARGIKVLVKPHLWSRDFSTEGKWHGDIEMTSEADTERWFAEYTAFIVEYADLAERAHADALAVGLEYVRMTKPRYTARWRALIATVRQHYRGPLTYGAHHGDEVAHIEFWDQLSAIGVHGYYPLSIDKPESEITAEDVARAWAPHLADLERIAQKSGKPIVFTELGYPAHHGALREPWHADAKRPEDQRLQAVAYAGTLAAFDAAPFVRGVFFWKWFSGGRDNPMESEPFEPEGRQAEAVLATWFARR